MRYFVELIPLNILNVCCFPPPTICNGELPCLHDSSFPGGLANTLSRRPRTSSTTPGMGRPLYSSNTAVVARMMGGFQDMVVVGGCIPGPDPPTRRHLGKNNNVSEHAFSLPFRTRVLRRVARRQQRAIDTDVLFVWHISTKGILT